MKAATRDAEVTISDGSGREVKTTVGDLGKLAGKIKKLSPAGQAVVKSALTGDPQPMLDAADDLGMNEPRNVSSPYSIGVQLASKDDFIQAIRNTQADIIRAKSEAGAAKEMLNEEVEQLDGWIDKQSAKEELKRASDELKAQMAESGEVETAEDNYEEKSDALARHRAIMSDLLVLYAAKFNSKTVEVEREQPRLILLSAKIGKVEPEQMRLF